MPLAAKPVIIEHKLGGLNETTAWLLEVIVAAIFDLDLTCFNFRLLNF